MQLKATESDHTAAVSVIWFGETKTDTDTKIMLKEENLSGLRFHCVVTFSIQLQTVCILQMMQIQSKSEKLPKEILGINYETVAGFTYFHQIFL